MEKIMNVALPCDEIDVYSTPMPAPTAPKRPTRARKKSNTIAIPGWIVQWSLPAIVSVIGLLAIWYVNNHIPAIVDNKFIPTYERLGKMEGKLDGFEIKLDLILKMSSIAKGPTANNLETYKDELSAMKGLLATAKSKGVIVKPDTVAQVGQLVLERDVDKPELRPIAWDTAVRFADYRSFLHAAMKPEFDTYNKYLAPSPPVKYPPGSMVRSVGSSWNRTTITLDWGDWDNSLFRGCLIRYEGGPLKLNKVEFENCEFVVEPDVKGKKLLDSILASANPTIDLK